MLLLLGYRFSDVEFLVLCGTCVIPALLAAWISRSSGSVKAILSAVVLFLILDLYLIDVVNLVVAIIDLTLLAILCWLLRARITIILGVGSLAFSVSVALTAQPLDPGDWITAQAAERVSRVPPVIHLILDEHCGADCFPHEVMNADERANMRSTYIDRGFNVWPGISSSFTNTQVSLASMVNPASTEPSQLVLKKFRGFEYSMTENEYFRLMAQSGYRVRVLQSDFLNFCAPNLPGDVECKTYAHNSAGILRFVDLTLGERWQLLRGIIDWWLRRGYDSFLYGEVMRSGIGARVEDWRGTRARWRVQPIIGQRMLKRVRADMDDIGPGDLYVAHVLVPHHPYVFDEDCNLLPVEQWVDIHVPSPITSASIRTERYKRYKAQMVCTDRRIIELVDSISNQDNLNGAIFILHGDHGSRIGPSEYSPIGGNYERVNHHRDFRSVFFAVKAPHAMPRSSADSEVPLPVAFWSIIDKTIAQDGSQAANIQFEH